MTVEVERAEPKLVQCFIDAITSGFLVGKHIVLDSLHCISTREVQITDCIVYLVEIFLVAVVACHASESIDLGCDVGAVEYFALLYPGVEFGPV